MKKKKTLHHISPTATALYVIKNLNTSKKFPKNNRVLIKDQKKINEQHKF